MPRRADARSQRYYRLVEFELDAAGARLVVDRDGSADEIARMRGAGDVDLSTDEILALTRR
ncbi:MAG: hypothetical protein ACR2GZ_00045 [Solirubrobacteraceae bacterium]